MVTFQLLQQSQINLVVSMMQDFYAIDKYPIMMDESNKLFETFIANPNLGKVWLIYQDEEVIGWIQDLNATRSVNIVLIKNSIFISFCLISE